MFNSVSCSFNINITWFNNIHLFYLSVSICWYQRGKASIGCCCKIRFIRHDEKIKKFIDDVGINIDIVIAIIHRTAYPFKGKIAELAKKRMEELFTYAGIPKNYSKTRQHYKDLVWFLSVSERIAGYALGDFDHAMVLA
jgi:hypothetical protein